MITYIYFWCAAVVFGLTAAGEARCVRKDGRCSFKGACLNKNDEGICKSFDIEMNGGDCIDLNGSEEYADHYLRIKLMNGFIEGSELSVVTTMYAGERRNTRAHLYSVDEASSREILNIRFGIKRNSMGNENFYERFPNDSKVMIPVGWAGTPVELINNIEKRENRRYLKNGGNFILSGLNRGRPLKFDSPDCEELKNPLVLHLTPQIFPDKICYHVPPTVASFKCPTKPIDGGTKVETKAENIATNCTIFDRRAAKRNTPPHSLLRQGFESGKMISLLALLKPDAKDFFLDILNTKNRVAFQLKVEPEKRIVLSDKLGKTWHEHTQSANSLFKVMETFKLDLYHEKDSLLIFVNDSMLARFSLDPNTNLSKAYLHVFGDVIVEMVCYKDGKAPVPVEFRAASLQQEDCMRKWAYSKQYDIPYTVLPKEISEGDSLLINMTAYMYEDRFVVNLQDKNKKSVLHLSFRKDTKLTVIRAGIRSKAVEKMPLVIGNNFQIRILNSGRKFEIHINGRHWESSLEADFHNPHYLKIYGNSLISGLCLNSAIY